MANEMAVNELTVKDVIDAEGFTVEEASGFSCRRCRTRLLVGAKSCPNCRFEFPIATPNIANVPEGYSPVRARVMASIYRDRIPDHERERARQAMQPYKPDYPNHRP